MVSLLMCLILGASTRSSEAGSSPSPLAWSPDGKWVAYVKRTVVAPDFEAYEQLFRGGAPPRREAGPPLYRLWATRVEDRVSSKLDESSQEIGPPAWRPDGAALAFVRVVGVENARRMEVVVQKGLDQQRVLRSSLLTDRPASEPGVPYLDVAWSPDGKRLAVPRSDPPGLVIVEVESGKELVALERATLPAWHPNGRELAYYRVDGSSALVVCRANLDGDGVDEDVLTHVSTPTQAPYWALNGRSLLVLDCPRAPDGSAQGVVMDLGRSGGRPVLIKQVENPLQPGQRCLGTWMAISERGVDQYYSVLVEGRDSAISVHRGAAVFDRFTPLDESIPVTALRLSGDEKDMAVRAGSPGPDGCAAILNLARKELIPLRPDEGSSDGWRRLLLSSLFRVMSLAGGASPSRSGVGFASVPTTIPLPATLKTGDRTGFRTGRLAAALREAGTHLETTREPTADDRVADLVLAYLSDEPGEALRALDALEGFENDPDRRVRLLGLRAQLEAISGQWLSASARLDYLAELFPALEESVPAGTDGGSFQVQSLGQEHAVWIQGLRKFVGEMKSAGTERGDGIELSPRPAPVVPRR